MCHWCGYGMQSMWAWGMLAIWLATALLAGGIWIWSRSDRRGVRSRDRSEEVLRQRYARGEIDDATYRRMLTQLFDKDGRNARTL